VIYRLYAPEDFDELYAIEEVCFQPPFRFDRRLMRRLVSRSDSATWIAEESGRMSGFAIVEWTASVEIMAYLQTLEVLPDWRGQGAGRELLKKAEETARGAGAKAVWLHVNEKNDGAIRMYENYGYLRRGREEDYYATDQAALVYEKPLGGIENV
jgi:[ribosomal protein S18]-alanine N-acetyltransferase